MPPAFDLEHRTHETPQGNRTLATLEDLEKRVTALEERVPVVEDDMGEIPRLVTMHFDLLRSEMQVMRTEMRAMERRIEKTIDTKLDAMEQRFDAKLDATVCSIAEVVSNIVKKR